VSLPSCTGELGRGEELNLAEAGSTMKSWSLGGSLAELGALQRLRRRGTELGSGEERTRALMTWTVTPPAVMRVGYDSRAHARAGARAAQAAAPQLAIMTKRINKNEIAYSVMTGGNSSRTTAGAPNRYE
jgi:hypothetical protein